MARKLRGKQVRSSHDQNVQLQRSDTTKDKNPQKQNIAENNTTHYDHHNQSEGS